MVLIRPLKLNILIYRLIRLGLIKKGFLMLIKEWDFSIPSYQKRLNKKHPFKYAHWMSPLISLWLSKTLKVLNGGQIKPIRMEYHK